MMYCIWHVSGKIAVGLGGALLHNLSRNDAEWLFGMIHPDIRHTVKIRPMHEAN
jgi:hypothetical protein